MVGIDNNNRAAIIKLRVKTVNGIRIGQKWQGEDNSPIVPDFQRAWFGTTQSVSMQKIKPNLQTDWQIE